MNISVISPEGRTVSLALDVYPAAINDYAKMTLNSPRQVTEALVTISDSDGTETYWGTATHNPFDIYNQDKADRIAISHAIGHFSRGTRADIWTAVHEILDISATAKAVLTLDLMYRKYGDRLADMMGLPKEGSSIQRIKELASAE